MRCLKRVLGCIGLGVLVCLCIGAGLFWYYERGVLAHVEGDKRGELVVDGRERTFWLHFPKHIPPTTPTALVIVLHGGGGSGANAAGMSGMSAVADREGFMVAYPDGSGRIKGHLLTWNAGNCCGYALDKQVDDVAFISALIDHLIVDYHADPARIFVTGMSNGGMMSHRLGCELSDKITAIAPVAGALNVTCEPTEPLGVMVMHGTADQHVMYNGGAPQRSVDRQHPRVDASVAAAIEFWVGHNQCGLTATTTTTPPIIMDTYSGCRDGGAVVLITVEGGGHAWPGGQPGSRFGDQPTQALVASETMWAFFAQHSQ